MTAADPQFDQQDSANRCYRHPDRQSFILCQRCGRTICPQCQTEAPVGYHCPECVREARASAPRTSRPLLKSVRRTGSSGPIVTYSLIGINVVIFLLQQLSPVVTYYLYYDPTLTASEPWRLITSVFAHSSIWHIALNMLSLFIFGRILEPMLGRSRYLALYLISGLGGSVAVLLLNPGGGVLGASGAVFGLMGAILVILRGLGGNGTQLLVLIGLNLAIGFIVPNVAWQAHVGGVITGALIALVYVRTRARRQQTLQWILVASVLAGLVVLTLIGITVFFS